VETSQSIWRGQLTIRRWGAHETMEYEVAVIVAFPRPLLNISGPHLVDSCHMMGAWTPQAFVRQHWCEINKVSGYIPRATHPPPLNVLNLPCPIPSTSLYTWCAVPVFKHP